MEDHKDQILDLIGNESFVRWVVHPNTETDHYWSKWLLTHPERKKEVEWARQVILSTQYKNTFQLPDQDYNRILSGIVDYNRQKKSQSLHFWETRTFYRISGIAAVILALIVSSVLLKDNSLSPPAEKARTELVRKFTESGQKLTMRLPDGSKVILNAESEISYADSFAVNREVYLSGEAFFEVEKDPARPFFIHTLHTTTKVIGTSFNIRSYADEPETSISVITGKVLVSDHSGHEASLVPDQQGVFNSREKRLFVTPFSREAVIGWKDGLIIFDNTPVPEVLSYLKKWYGVEFEVADESLLSGRYTGRYENASLQGVLNGLSYASGFKFQIKGKKVIINKQTNSGL